MAKYRNTILYARGGIDMNAMNNTTKDKKISLLPKDLFFLALNSAVDAVVITDNNGEILWVNSAFEQLTKYSMHEAIGKDTSLLKSGRQSEQFYQSMWNTLTSAKVWQGQLWNKKKCGEQYLEEQTITPVVNAKNEITHFIAIKRDVSEKVAIKRQLEHAEKMEAIGQLVGGISHNFNNKLTSILGYNDLAIELSEQISDPQFDKYLDKTKLAALEAKKLVSQLQIFCREEGKHYKAISLVEVIGEILQLVTNTIPEKVKFTFSSDNDVAKIEADPAQLHQMLMILIHNSIKALPDGGNIRVQVNKVSLSEEVCSSCHQNFDGNYIELSVSDNGSGILQKYIKKLFLPFFTTDKIGGGTGMGLSILHGMLHEHNGHIRVTNEQEKETSFRLFFPVYQQNVANKDQSVIEPTSACELAKTHILLVDDELSFALLMVEFLERAGYKVTTKTDVQSALSLYMSMPEQFDILITDQNMPGITGLMLIRAVKSVNANLPAILVSGKSSEEFKDDANFNELVNGFLSKPFKTEQLYQLVTDLTNK